MSGSSLDGLDIAFVQLEEVRGKWSYQVLKADCIAYNDEWEAQLRKSPNLSVADLLRLHTAYGRFLGQTVSTFIETHNLQHQAAFIASHGHTVFHEPASRTTFQLGEGAALAAVAGLPVISDLRTMDVALGGQGAPIVPVADALLFNQYDYLLNIGGIANITVWQNGQPTAFDICPANQVLNELAARAGKKMDEGGAIAASGNTLLAVLDELDSKAYYHMPPPKSLSNEAACDLMFPSLLESDHSLPDRLHTATVHIARQIAKAVAQFPTGKEQARLLVTGGGAFNTFLVERIKHALAPAVEVVVPDAETVMYKEAIAMALIGTLRWREEANVYSSVTGAIRDSIGGALWMG